MTHNTYLSMSTARRKRLQSGIMRNYYGKRIAAKAKVLAVVLNILLLHPVNADPKADIKFFISGDKIAFDSTGHAKSKGVRVKLFYPKTWKALEGSRPNIIQKLVSDNGTGMATVMLETHSFPPELNHELTNDEKNEMVSEDVMKSLVPEGAKILSYKRTKLDGEPCGMIESFMISERAGLSIVSFYTVYLVPVKGGLLKIGTSFGGDSAVEASVFQARYSEVKPLLTLIASSCVLLDKWEKK